jgi:hypothetical protein
MSGIGPVAQQSSSHVLETPQPPAILKPRDIVIVWVRPPDVLDLIQQQLLGRSYLIKNRKMGPVLARFLPAPSIASRILVGILN